MSIKGPGLANLASGLATAWLEDLPVIAVTEAFGPGDAPVADWVILLVKTGDTRDAALTARALAPRGVVSLQNGLVEDVLRDACAGLPVGQGITTEGAFRDGLAVQPAGAGDTLLPPGFEAVAARLDLPPGLLCPRRLIEQFVVTRAWPAGLHGWRAGVLEAELTPLLAA